VCAEFAIQKCRDAEPHAAVRGQCRVEPALAIEGIEVVHSSVRGSRDVIPGAVISLREAFWLNLGSCHYRVDEHAAFAAPPHPEVPILVASEFWRKPPRSRNTADRQAKFAVIKHADACSRSRYFAVPRAIGSAKGGQCAWVPELLDEVRKATAGRYLDRSELAISEIAYLLGYSEPAAFHRAFKRWYATTPEHFRTRAR